MTARAVPDLPLCDQSDCTREDHLIGFLRAEVLRERRRRRLEDAFMVDGIAVLEALYNNGRRDRWIAPHVYESIERAVLGLRAALTNTTSDET